MLSTSDARLDRTRAPEEKTLPPGPETEGPTATWYAWVKAAGDFAVALVLLVVLTPLLLVVGVLVKLTSSGPALYSQLRLGKNGRAYRIYKFRTMWHNCEQQSGPQWSRPGDPRVTRLGRLLRRTHLDELPQLWNVLRGDMSLVGPRPERPEIVPLLEEAIPGYRRRLLVRPGVTGLAQLQLPPDTDLASVRRKLAHDLYYVQCCGPWLDLRILLATAGYLAGTSVGLLQRLRLVPSGAEVERVSHLPSADPVRVPRLQPA